MGQHNVPSKEAPGTDIVLAPLLDNMRYLDTILRVACAVLADMQPTALLAFVRSRDESTRARMIELIRSANPLGVASGRGVNKAWRENELRCGQVRRWTSRQRRPLPLQTSACTQPPISMDRSSASAAVWFSWLRWKLRTPRCLRCCPQGRLRALRVPAKVGRGPPR